MDSDDSDTGEQEEEELSFAAMFVVGCIPIFSPVQHAQGRFGRQKIPRFPYTRRQVNFEDLEEEWVSRICREGAGFFSLFSSITNSL